MSQRPKTRTELQESRKNQLRQIGNDFIEKHAKKNPPILEIPTHTPSRSYHFCSPYIDSPNIKTKTELDLFRRSQSIYENSKTVHFDCKTLSERVEEREKIRQIPQSPPKDRPKNTDYLAGLQEKFGKQPVGVHGEELPKFSENLREFWKVRDGYIENPKVIKKEDHSRPVSVFTRLRAKSGSVDYEITKKPGEINPFPGFVIRDNEGFGSRPSSRSKVEESFIRSRPQSVKIKRFRPKTNVVSGQWSRMKTEGLKERCLVRSSGFSV